MLNELDIVMRENACPHIVQFYGALFKEVRLSVLPSNEASWNSLQGDCWICMELLDTSLDLFYKFVYHKLDQFIPESVLAYITLAVRTDICLSREDRSLFSLDARSVGLHQVSLADYPSRCQTIEYLSFENDNQIV